MRLSRFALPILVLAASAAAVRADDAPKTYPLNVKPVYTVGETWTITTHDQQTVGAKVALEDGTVLQDTTTPDVVDFVAIHEVVEVAADGSVAKEKVHYSSWKRALGGQSTSDLAQATVEVSGKGMSRSWKLLTPDKVLSAPTKEWVEKMHGKDEHGKFGETLAPPAPVAVGESWDLDAAKVFEAFGKNMTFDPSKSTLKATLKSVDGDVALVGISMRLQVLTIASAGGPMSVVEGGMLEMDGEGRAPLAETARGDVGTMTMKLVAKASAQTVNVTLSIDGDKASTYLVGGAIPTIPEPETK